MQTQDKKSSVSFKDVQITYLMNGVDSVIQMYEKGNASKTTVRRALRQLKNSGQSVEKLEDWVIQQFGSSGRGRTSPNAGETRMYKAQKVNNSGSFLRLPLDVLGVDKGQKLRVRFESDMITVSKK
jgi:hypothetical protein